MPNYNNHFAYRHLGPSPEEQENMLAQIGAENLEKLIEETVPPTIRMKESLDIPPALTEQEYLGHVSEICKKNKIYKSYIGRGYYGTFTPSVILRNVFQNPGWYTQYTPYQAEISQGRMESLLNFQTVVSDLTGLPIANASLLDEATAAAEAMTMMQNIVNKKRKKDPANKFFVDHRIFGQTKAVIHTRAIPLHIEVVQGDWRTHEFDDSYFGVMLQYPDAIGAIHDYSAFAENCKEKGMMVACATDLLSLTLLVPPGEWGAEIVVGNSQRFGVPLGYGGPHAAFFATVEEHKRLIPGRIIGISEDVHGKKALRMALQTREQHIRREKATSNICTAQALLANMAAMYAVFHGPEGLKNIAETIYNKAAVLHGSLSALGLEVVNQTFFDTVTISLTSGELSRLQNHAIEKEINLYYGSNLVSISLDETTTESDLNALIALFKSFTNQSADPTASKGIPQNLSRTSDYLSHPVFHTHRTETELMRYIKSLENKDISLVHSMIPLGSCTMKLNAASEMIPVSWGGFANLHPFVPEDQALGYQQIFEELEQYLCACTGFTACSLQPNSGAQGEYAGLMAIRSYHFERGDSNRNVALIPSSAHGTNPASAVMVGMEVVVVACDERGNINIDDFREKAQQYSDRLSALLVTYPSTHGVYETSIKEICEIVHNHGGLVYMDGANMNAQVGLTSPGMIGADVCHLNLHKTFAIPHGGGGPGMGPICVNEKLAPYLPGHAYGTKTSALNQVSAAAWGSASILLISYGYIRMLGAEGLKNCSEIAILNANYLKSRLETAYDILYTGEFGRAAHEFIVDLRAFKGAGISAEDVAKRLIDYGFHAPTLSFPVPGTIMIEPTESENKEELDRFCDALLEIRKEIDEVALGHFDASNNVLVNAPHTLDLVTSDDWNLPYSRSKAAYPLSYLKTGSKFWATVGRVDNALGDRNLICVCPPIEDYMAEG